PTEPPRLADENGNDHIQWLCIISCVTCSTIPHLAAAVRAATRLVAVICQDSCALCRGQTAYFSLQVISARRVFRVSPPLTTGPPEFERVYRAQVNCSEYFPLFLATLWVAGIFFHEGAAALCGLVYLFARLRYFQGYARSPQQR
uniref:Leukotriene C4 synthase n=1 Tax=Felis catus TaxID=9685 RepID=A0ABI7ZJM1_FELCA